MPDEQRIDDTKKVTLIDLYEKIDNCTRQEFIDSELDELGGEYDVTVERLGEFYDRAKDVMDRYVKWVAKE